MSATRKKYWIAILPFILLFTGWATLALTGGTRTDQPNSDTTVDYNSSGSLSAIAVKVHEIQGPGSTVQIKKRVSVEAVVTTLFEKNDAVEGFFLQEEDTDADADPLTSEGIFVYCGRQCPAELSTDQLVNVLGTPAEYFGMSQINANKKGASVTILGKASARISPVVFTLPANSSTTEEATFEFLEGMLVTHPGKLVVSEYFQLGRFGQLILSAATRTHQFTATNLPSVAGFARFQDALDASRIILDDLDNDQNEALGVPDEPYFYPQDGLTTNNYFRGGDSIRGLTGVMHWSFAGSKGTNAWRIRPLLDQDYIFSLENPRPIEPAPVAGDLKVASFNVLNYFTTIDTAGNVCGPSRLACRGADSMAELRRQRSKIIAALSHLNADIFVLVEIENDAGAALHSLATALSNATGKTFRSIDTGSIGTDAIKVGMLYNTNKVNPAGLFAILDRSIDSRFNDRRNRPMLAQTFTDLASGAKFTVVAGHLKSKGSNCDDLGDRDIGDGQGNCNKTRTLATHALTTWLATDPTHSGNSNILVLGDFNAYAMEDPIVTMERAGYTNLIQKIIGPDAYSYVFDGQLGYLDHALASPSLQKQVTGASIWHINADEVNLLDYNDTVQDPSEATFERRSSANELFTVNPVRASDHDPIIVGLSF